MEQPDLFTGDELRDHGISAAERDRTLIIETVDRLIKVWADGGGSFTAENVRLSLDPAVRELEDVSKVIGGRIRAAAVRGDIYTTGETVIAQRPSAHARRMLVWHGKVDIMEVLT